MGNIFSYNSDRAKNACMNWRTQRFDHIHNMVVIAKGFSDSALSLVKEILEDNRDHKADNWIFPILFNANHSIEVYLKAICWTQNRLLDKKDKFAENHNLEGLFKDVVDLEKELNSGDIAVFHERLSDLKAYIHELYGKIERTIIKNNGKKKILHDITFCRYSLNTDLEPQFYINTFDNVVVDLENFLTVFEGIFDNLDSLAIHYLELLERKDETEYEARQIQEEIAAEFRDDY